VKVCVRVRDVVEPQPKWQEAYTDGYQGFRALYPALQPHFRAHGAGIS
jgi:hypothetical protein